MTHVATTHSSFWYPKRNVLLASIVFAALMGPLILFATEQAFPAAAIRYLLIIGIALLVLAWCYFDAYEQHQPFGSGWRVAILLFGVVALFIYLFKSRGLKNGARSALLALTFCLGLVAIVFASAVLFGLVFWVQ